MNGRMIQPANGNEQDREMNEEDFMLSGEDGGSGMEESDVEDVTDGQLVLWADAAEREHYTTPFIPRSLPHSLPQSTTITPVPSSLCIYSVKAPFSSESDFGTDIFCACRICHLPGDEQDPIFSPCRCSGTLQYIHYSCLLKWIQISSKKSRKPPKCELCHYQFHRHKKFKFHSWKLPKVNRRDKFLHSIFILNLLIMISCAVATVMCFLSDKGQISKFPKNRAELTTEEIITLSCGVLFFVSFFIAMSVEIKAKHTIYKLIVKFLMQNMEWEIEEYDREKDKLFCKPITFV